MNRNLLTALVLAAPLALASCKKSAPEPTEIIIPLAVGNEWTYQLMRYTASGDPVDTIRLTRSVVKDTLIDKRTWYVMSDRARVQNSPEGYISFSPREEPLLYPSSRIGNLGYHYDMPGYGLWVLTQPFEQQPSILTPKGQFTTFGYTVNYEALYTGTTTPKFTKREDYVAPGVGMVRSDQYYSDSPVLRQRLLLVDYKLR